MIVHLPAIALDAIILRAPLRDFEVGARDHDVGRVGAAAPFLAVGAVAERRDLRGAGVGIGDGAAEAGACCHV